MLRVALVYPELLGTYGDGGNGTVLVERARRRGIEAELLHVGIEDDLPDAAIYLLGGGEDGPQRLGADLLRASSLTARVGDGASVLAVCAGLQLLGTTFAVEGDDEYAGVGLVDARTRRGERRAVGEILVEVEGRPLVGFENHGGQTELGAGITPLGVVRRGVGNDGRVDGFHTERCWASYAHGPLLALNPWFADEILERVLDVTLEPLSTTADLLYDERVKALSA